MNRAPIQNPKELIRQFQNRLDLVEPKEPTSQGIVRHQVTLEPPCRPSSRELGLPASYDQSHKAHE
jgi:hypothetical protein